MPRHAVVEQHDVGRLALDGGHAQIDAPTDGLPLVPPEIQVVRFQGLERVPQAEAVAGDIVLVTGIDDLAIGSANTKREGADEDRAVIARRLGDIVEPR